MNAVDVAGRLGVSQRQINYWARKGYLRAPTPGSGHVHDVPDSEFDYLRLMTSLLDAGMELRKAAFVARRFHDAGPELLSLRITPKVTITIERN